MTQVYADLLAPLRQIALSDGGRTALLAHNRSPTSFHRLVQIIEAAQAALRGAGVTSKSRVVTLLPNGPETAVAIAAIASISTCIPLNPAYPDEETQRLLRDARATHLVTNAQKGFEDVRQILLAPDLVASTGTFFLSDLGGELARASHDGTSTADRIAIVLHTSGSTGMPKRVPLSVTNLLVSTHSLARSLHLTAGDVCLNMMPMFHIGALVDLLLAPLSVGGAVAFADEISTPAMFRGLAAFKPSWFQAVPTVLRDILASEPSAGQAPGLQQLRFVRAVSQTLPVPLQETFERRFGVKLVPIFGMTETAGLITSMPLDAHVPGSVGVPFGPQVRVIDGFGNALPPNRRGEVIVSGETVMSGYEDHPSERAETFLGKWLRTGDEGYFDEAGFLFLTGRLKDIINRGGEKISPLEIDLLLADHPRISEAAAFPVPHPTLGEEVAVAVVSRGALQDREVTDFLRGRLADYKVPRQVFFIDKLPRVPSGKLDRKALPSLTVGTGTDRIRTAPDNPIAKALAALWRETLGVGDIVLEDDFFDLGGDSLRATALAMRIEERFGHTVPIGNLFDAPTLREMAATIAESKGPDAAKPVLDPKIYARMTQVMAGWQGQRQPGSLIVGRNTLGRKNPFFWVPQTLHGFDALATVLDPDRPIYAMTSLSQTGLKTDENTRRLARYYAHEMMRILPQGPFLIGGFCQGGVVAFHIAKTLRAEGHEVALLVLQDRFIAEPYDGCVSMFWGKGDWFSNFDYNYHPERAWAKHYPGPVAVHLTDAEHFELHNPPHIQTFARQLEADIAKIEHGETLGTKPERLPIITEKLKFHITARCPVFLEQGSQLVVQARVTNHNSYTWQPSITSGIVVAGRWRVDSQDRAPYLGDAQADLTEALAPGDEIQVDLHLRMPMRGLPMLLEIEVMEDGMFFGEAIQPAKWRRLIVPLRPRLG